MKSGQNKVSPFATDSMMNDDERLFNKKETDRLKREIELQKSVKSYKLDIDDIENGILKRMDSPDCLRTSKREHTKREEDHGMHPFNISHTGFNSQQGKLLLYSDNETLDELDKVLG